MNSDFSPELRKELLDDFYAECDELLTAARENLVALARGLAAKSDVGAVVESLFRSTHSLKGIAAIAGVRAAEQLAHAMEDLLRALTKAEVGLTEERRMILLDATQRLEQIISAHRLGSSPPDGESLSIRLRQLAAAQGAEAAGSEQRTPSPSVRATTSDVVSGLRERGLVPWRATFSPSAALDQRGVNVTAIRERLGQLGEIASAAPTVRPNAAIVFEFTLGIQPGREPTDFAEWEADGVRFEPLAENGVTATAADGPAHGDETNTAISLTPSHMVRVDLARLDELMRITGDLVIQRSRLEERVNRESGGSEVLKQIDLGFSRLLRELRKAIARVRLVPIAEIFTRMPYVVRDLAADSDKQVRVVLEGHQTEIDKYLVERLKEPLLHLVRNAFTHGIELPAARTAAGKPAEATIVLRATSVGDSVVIQVRDDGQGIDANAVAERSRVLGMALPPKLDATGVLQVLCAPGFSTRDEVDRAAGRGVGMAVVANTVRELGGTLSLETKLGVGSEFTLRLPVTVSIIDAIIASVGSETCAVPQSAVVEIVQIPAGEVRRIRETEIVPYRGGLLPFLRLRNVFRMEPGDASMLTILVLSSERGATGLVVDRVRTRREVVVRPLTDPLVRVPGVSGATELGDGRPILILDPNALTGGVVRPPAVVEELVFT